MYFLFLGCNHSQKDMAAMLDDITKAAYKKYSVNVLQHGSDDITCNPRIPYSPIDHIALCALVGN
jgi:hypothetical protein